MGGGAAYRITPPVSPRLRIQEVPSRKGHTKGQHIHPVAQEGYSLLKPRGTRSSAPARVPQAIIPPTNLPLLGRWTSLEVGANVLPMTASCGGWGKSYVDPRLKPEPATS